MSVPGRRRRFWGWGWEDAGPSPAQQEAIAQAVAARLGLDAVAVTPPPRLEEIALPPPRIAAPARLAPICSAAPYDRAGHTYGKSFRDVVRAYRRDFRQPPDLVAFPRDEADVAAVLEWATGARVAVVPYGGGSSVVGGVEPPRDDRFAGVVSLDLGRLDRVLEVDTVSQAARIQAGALGPALEEQLRPHGLTLRHFPQSFEFSTLGGWIATRSGGHYATLYTHIDDFVEALRVVTPTGVMASRRLPGSGAGPSPERLFMGSEGILGVIVEAWMRLQARPTFRAAATVTFPDFAAGAAAVRAIAQAGLYPANCRLLDAAEAATAGAGDGQAAVLLLAFESADHPLDAWMARALECAADHGGRFAPEAGRTRTSGEGEREGAAGAWRRAFLDAPYLRDALVGMGLVTETFETDHVGSLSRLPRRGDDRHHRRRPPRVRARPGDGALHARLSRRPGPVLHGARSRAAEKPARAVGRDQGRSLRGDPRRRRHDHPSPRRRPRSPSLVRPRAPGPLCRRARRGQGGARPGGHLEPRRPDRRVTRAATPRPSSARGG